MLFFKRRIEYVFLPLISTKFMHFSENFILGSMKILESFKIIEESRAPPSPNFCGRPRSFWIELSKKLNDTGLVCAQFHIYDVQDADWTVYRYNYFIVNAKIGSLSSMHVGFE